MAETLEIFQQRVDAVIDYITNNRPNFAEYFSKRIISTLQQNIRISLASGISPHLLTTIVNLLTMLSNN